MLWARVYFELKPVYFKFAEIQVQKFNYLKKK